MALGWLHRKHRAIVALDRLFDASRRGDLQLIVSVLNLVEVIRHTRALSRAKGTDPIVLLRAYGVGFHQPAEATALRVARLETSLADGFAAATAMELGARLHTTDGELVRQLKGSGLAVSHY